MSTEYYVVCEVCHRRIHTGTCYSSGFKLFTIGPTVVEVQDFINEHIACDAPLRLGHEHEKGWD